MRAKNSTITNTTCCIYKETKIHIRNWIMIEEEIVAIPMHKEVFPHSEIDSCFLADSNMKVKLVDGAREMK